MKRVTYRSISERKNNSEYSELPKLKDILVDLSVKNTPKVERKLRLVGEPIEFVEYNDKKRLPGEKYKTEKVAFPDADKTKMITRIGMDDKSSCPWYKAGYVGSRKFAVKCFEQQADKSWVPKILCKGPSVFDEFGKWTETQFLNLEDDPGADICTFLGGDSAPMVRIVAVKDDSKLGGVDYNVFAGSVNVKLTEEMIESLRKINEPSADELNRLRSEYLGEMKKDPTIPEWRDYFEYGFDLRRIFKYTPPIGEESSYKPSVSSKDTETSLDDSSPDEQSETEASGSNELADLNW